MATRPHRPRDANQLAKLIVDISTGDVLPEPQEKPQTQYQIAAAGFGRKGGKARSNALSTKRKKAIARQAANARWAKKR